MTGEVQRGSSAYVELEHRWPDGPITWSFKERFFGSDAAREDGLRDVTYGDMWRGLTRDALAAWEAVCGVDFVEVQDGPGVDIRFGFLSAPGGADGPTGTLASYSVWWRDGTTLRAYIGLDAEDLLNADDVYDTLLHEIGHAVGLGHSDVEGVVMSGNEPFGTTEYWEGEPGRDPLQPDDIAGAVKIWGPPREGGSPPTTRPETPGQPTEPVVLTGTPEADTLQGDGGDDTISGRGGSDTLWGEGGADSLQGDAGHDLLFGQEGPDTLSGGSGQDTLMGGEGDDSAQGGSGDDALWGEEGADTLRGGSGKDVLGGGPGDDSLEGNGGADYVWGEAGDDHLDGGPERDVLVGGDGADTLQGGDEGDTFFGGGGPQAGDGARDVFIVEGGLNWLMDFELGLDVLQVAGSTEAALKASAEQVGEHLRLTGSGGETIWLAGHTVEDLAKVSLTEGTRTEPPEEPASPPEEPASPPEEPASPPEEPASPPEEPASPPEEPTDPPVGPSGPSGPEPEPVTVECEDPPWTAPGCDDDSLIWNQMGTDDGLGIG